jgi:hypothetical protein
MLHLFFMMMLIGFIAGLIALPVMTAPLVPWWGTLLIILGELVFLRYTLFKILGLMFGIFTWVGIRIGVSGMRGARVDIHSVKVVPPPGPEQVVRPESGSVDLDPDEEDEAREPDPAGTRFVRVECTVTPSPKLATSNWPAKHYDAGSFTISSQRFVWPKFPPEDDPTRTGVLAAAALMDGETVTPIAADKQVLGSQRLALTFKCPPSLKGPAKLKFIVLPLATVDVPEASEPATRQAIA